MPKFYIYFGMESSFFEKQISRKKRKRRTIVALTAIIVLMASIIIYIVKVVNPIIISIGEAKIGSLATRSINSAVSEVLSMGYNYSSLINITTDSNGDIVLIEANALQINKLAKEVAMTSQTKLDLIGSQGISVPIGSLTGIPIFMGKGNEVRFKLFPVGSITCTFSSQFMSAGINQTHHKIYVDINYTVNVVLPINNKKIDNQSQVMVAESIIIGKVPDVYLNANSLDNMLPLIP